MGTMSFEMATVLQCNHCGERHCEDHFVQEANHTHLECMVLPLHLPVANSSLVIKDALRHKEVWQWLDDKANFGSGRKPTNNIVSNWCQVREVVSDAMPQNLMKKN